MIDYRCGSELPSRDYYGYWWMIVIGLRIIGKGIIVSQALFFGA